MWLPGGHQFLAGRHPLQVSSVPGPVPLFSLNESYKIQRDKKSVWCLSIGKGQQKNLYSAALSLLRTDLKVGVETPNSQLSFVILKSRSMLKGLPEGSSLTLKYKNPQKITEL